MSKMKKSNIGIIALTIGVIATAGTALASRNGFEMGFMNEGISSAENTAIQEAIAANDYASWKEAMTESFTSTLTEDRFNEIVNNYQSRDAINQALESGDYEAWKTAVEASSNRITDVITAGNFATYSEMYKAEASGDFETANQLRQELGLGRGMMPEHPRQMHGQLSVGV
jgi:hypothetical protein